MTDIPVQPVLPAGEFRVGQALSRAFSILFGDFAKFFLIGLVTALPSMVNTIYSGSSGNVARLARANPGSFFLESAAVVILFFLIYLLSQAVTLYGAFQLMRDRPFTWGPAFSRGLARFFPLLGLYVCVGLGILVAMLALIVPGIILATSLYVAVPVCVLEQAGVFHSMGRSAELTKGHRWRILGILLLVIFGNVLGGGLLGAVLGVTTGLMGAAIGSFIWNALVSAYSAIVVAVAYHDLRVLKDGIDIDRIAAVFD